MLVDSDLHERLDTLCEHQGKPDDARRRAPRGVGPPSRDQAPNQREPSGREEPMLWPGKTQSMMRGPSEVPVNVNDGSEGENECCVTQSAHVSTVILR